MKITKIEPTPSPNTLKINLDFKREDTKSKTYKAVDPINPAFINSILSIEGITSVFHVLDFISVDKSPKEDWELLLPKVEAVFDSESVETAAVELDTGEKLVEVLMFKEIPYQIKVTHSKGEQRKQLDVRFIDAMLSAQKDEDNVVFLRRWVSLGNRYGENDEIIASVIEEMNALYPDSRLSELVEEGLEINYQVKEKALKRISKAEYLNETDWQKRYRMLDHFPNPEIDDLPLFEAVMQDDKPQLRRLGVVFLGMYEDARVLPLLHQAMKDKNLTIRRTAGDTLSDLGFKESLQVMHEALDDKHPIVRWRAAMFIFDEGDESSLPYLETHLDDEAFEVRLQCRMAYERIKNGEAAAGSVWKQIANRNKEENE